MNTNSNTKEFKYVFRNNQYLKKMNINEKYRMLFNKKLSVDLFIYYFTILHKGVEKINLN